MTAKKKDHPEDAMLAEQVRRATRFSACLHLGPGQRHTRYVEQGGRAGYEGALAEAAELQKLSRYGRRSIIYAINPLGSFPVDDKLAAMAGLVDA